MTLQRLCMVGLNCTICCNALICQMSPVIAAAFILGGALANSLAAVMGCSSAFAVVGSNSVLK